MEKMYTGYAKAEINILRGKSILPETEIIKTIESDNMAIDSITITTGCYDGNAVGVGNVHSSQCTITMDETDDIKIGDFFQIVFLPEGESIYAGSYYVNSRPTYSGEKMTINAIGEPSTILDNHIPEKIPDGVLKKTNPFYTTEGMTGQELRQRYFPYLTYASDDSAKYQMENYLYRAPIPYRSWDVENQDWIVNIGDRPTLKVREVLAGLALHYGGNVVERNGSFYMTKKQGENVGEFSVDDCDSSYELSRESYGIRTVQQSKLPDIMVTKNSEPPYPYALYGTERQRRLFLATQTDALHADVKYDQVVECDWLGTGIGPDSTTGGYPIGCIVQGDLMYHTGKFSFVGYNEKLYAGNKINIHLEDGEEIPFVIAEMELKWDGGFSTDISCQFSESNMGGGVMSSTSSSSISSQNIIAGLSNYNAKNFSYADFTNAIEHSFPGFLLKEKTIEGWAIRDATITGAKIDNGTITDSNIADSTITGSKFEDGTITGSKIENSTITGNLIANNTLTGAKIVDATIGFEKVDTSFITKLTADSAYIKDLTARVASINTLKADDAIIKNIQTVAISADYIRAITADIGYLKADEADIKYANITLGNIDTANIDKANIGLLFNEVGLIDRATIVDGHITGFLDAVEVNANKITAGTLIAERLLLKGSEDGLLFALNNMGELVSQNVDTLDGGILTERTVTADKLVAKSITANELDVANIFSDKAVIKEIFAQDVEASGTITGATLMGAEAYIDFGIIGPFIISEDGLDYDGDSYHFQIGKDSLNIAKTATPNEAIILNRDGFRYNKSRYSLHTGTDTLNPLARQGELDLTFTRTEHDNSVKTTWINVRGIHTSAPTNSGAAETQPFAMDVKTLDVSGQIKAKNGLISSSDQGFASVASDIEGGRIQLKGSGNCYEIDAAGGTLRFIDVPAGKTMALMNSTALYSIGEMVISNSKSIRFGTPTSDYMIKGTETTITIGDKDAGGNSGYVYLQGDTKVLTGSLEAPKIKEGGELLTEKYCYYQEGTGSVPGGSGWMGVTATFPKPYLKKPFVMVVQNTATSTENIWIKATSEKAVSFEVYAPNSAWTYSYRWMAIGIKA